MKTSKSEKLKEKQYNIHEVACILAELFDDNCACNYNDINDWLPNHCDFAQTSCPDPDGVSCWEQYLKYRNFANKGDL